MDSTLISKCRPTLKLKLKPVKFVKPIKPVNPIKPKPIKPKPVKKSRHTQAVTITYGDQAENHAGMQMIGKMRDRGMSIKELRRAQAKFEQEGYETELIDLHTGLSDEEQDLPGVDPAMVLVVRNGVEALLSETGGSADSMMVEQSALAPDGRAFMYGRVVNKHARTNLCFGDFSQEANFDEVKAGLAQEPPVKIKCQGTVVDFKDLPNTAEIRRRLPEYVGSDIVENLQAEGNYYFKPKVCGIGWHGDAERRIVVAVRLGVSIPLHYHWFHWGKIIGERVSIELHHGDVYFMSDKATGYDWKKKKFATLRHSAGCDKFTKLNPKWSE